MKNAHERKKISTWINPEMQLVWHTYLIITFSIKFAQNLAENRNDWDSTDCLSEWVFGKKGAVKNVEFLSKVMK